MEEQKNIDRLFQEKFKDFEVFPEPVVWKNIEKQLMKKKKKRIIPLWLRLGSAAAILIGVIFSGIWYVNLPDKFETPIKNPLEEVPQATGKSAPSNTKAPLTNEPEPQSAKAIVSTPVKEKEVGIANHQTPEISNEETAELVAEELDRSSSLTEVTPVDDVVSTATSKTETLADGEIKSTDKTSILDAANAMAAAEEEEKATELALNERLSKWSIGSNVAPVFYNSLGNGSPIDPDLASNSKMANTGLSYGIKVNYKVSNRFTLQSGLNTVELGYETRNAAVLLSSSLVSASNANINAEIEGVGVEVVSTQQQNSETFSQRSLFDNAGKIDQSFNYIELPIEAKYAVIQNKFGVNLVGGFSTYLLYQDNISVTSFGKTTSLGEASNVNTLNFSGNVGLDLNYSLSKKLYFNASPMIKYQFNTFSENSGGFKPYFFGVYAGLNFRF